MLSFGIEGGRAAANAVTRACAQAFAPTLGDVATMLSHPATSSHREISPEAQRAVGIDEGFFRVSVGIEPPDYVVDAILEGVRAASAATN